MTKKLVILLFSCFSTFITIAQTIPASSTGGAGASQIEQYYQMAKSMGMTDMQIENEALKRGFSLTDVARLRQGAGQRTGSGQGLLDGDLDTLFSRRQNGTLTTKSRDLIAARDSILRFKEAIIGLRDSLPGAKGSIIFGSKLFSNENLRFEANLRVATPSNYFLGPDDELRIDISGNTSASYTAKVSPEGTIKMKDFIPVYVNGLTVEQAKVKIINRLRDGYSGLGGGAIATVTLGNVRSIKVTITGEARKPGTYTVSSLNTAFNALYLCGGPNAKGSFRNVQVIRNNKTVRTIDLYDYLVRANQADNILLHDQDIIHIPYYGNRVQIDGEVRQPAIFEMKEGETFNDLLKFTGGFADQAYRANINIKRMGERDQQIMSLAPSDFATFKMQGGDRIQINRIVLNRFSNRVVVHGAIVQAGEYAVNDKIKTVKQLIMSADGLREDAFLKRAVLHRKKDNLETEVLSINIGAILSGEAEDVPIRNRDSLYIRSVSELREKYYVTILGEINKGGDFEYEENMTVSDLIAMSRGLREGAIGSRIEIARRITDNNANAVDNQYDTQIIELKIDKGLSVNPNDALFKLQPFDIVFVRKSPRYQSQQSVYILGEVHYPGLYAIVNNAERINDLLTRAGGMKPAGYLQGASFFRKKNRIALDIEKIASNPGLESNLLLENGDSLYIPKRSETVQISGEVLNPSFINFNKAYTFDDYLSQAGGYSKKALRRRVFVTYANGYTTRSRNFLIFKTNPKIEPGAVINVPAKPENKNEIPVVALLGVLSPIIASTILLLKP